VFLLDGKPLALDRAFTHAGVQYPANWLRLASPSERTAIGITETPGPTPYDQRFYWGWTASGTLIPKDHEQLVTLWSDTTKNTANTLLNPTDWMVVREADNGTVVPSGVRTWRQSVRNACEAKLTSIILTQTTDELATYVTYSSPSGATTDYSYWPSLEESSSPSGSASLDSSVSLDTDTLDFYGATTGTVIF
jgi:hypothetical protein